MQGFFSFFDEHYIGIIVFLACILTLTAIIRWMAWTFAIGRFSNKGEVQKEGNSHGDGTLRFVVGDLLVKVIDDFRHLLALIIVLMFALALGYVLIQAGSDSADISKGLQSVTSSLGGIIGAILGYYFGESAARGSQGAPVVLSGNGVSIQEAGEPSAQDAASTAVRSAPQPPPRSKKNE